MIDLWRLDFQRYAESGTIYTDIIVPLYCCQVCGAIAFGCHFSLLATDDWRAELRRFVIAGGDRPCNCVEELWLSPS